MRDRFPQLLDMTAQGDFVTAPPRSDWPVKLGVGAAVIAAGAAALVLASLFLWVVSLLVPLALLAGVVAYAAFRYQVWRTGRARRSPMRRSRPL